MSKSIKKLRELSVDELATRRRDLKEEALMLRVQKEAGQLENPLRIRLARREVAVIETLMTQKRTGSHA